MTDPKSRVQLALELAGYLPGNCSLEHCEAVSLIADKLADGDPRTAFVAIANLLLAEGRRHPIARANHTGVIPGSMAELSMAHMTFGAAHPAPTSSLGEDKPEHQNWNQVLDYIPLLRDAVDCADGLGKENQRGVGVALTAIRIALIAARDYATHDGLTAAGAKTWREEFEREEKAAREGRVALESERQHSREVVLHNQRLAVVVEAARNARRNNMGWLVKLCAALDELDRTEGEQAATPPESPVPVEAPREIRVGSKWRSNLYGHLRTIERYDPGMTVRWSDASGYEDQWDSALFFAKHTWLSDPEPPAERPVVGEEEL